MENRGPEPDNNLDKIFEKIKTELAGIKEELKSDLKNQIAEIRAEFKTEIDDLKSTRPTPPPQPPPAFTPPFVDIPVMPDINDNESNRKSEDYSYKDFTNIEIVGTFDVEITRADSYSIGITAEDRLFRNLDITKEGDTLRIHHSRHLGWRAWITRPRVRISMPVLKNLRLSGASKATASGFNSTEPFKLEVTGASSFAADLTVGDAEIKLSGASNARLNGSARDIVIEASGANHLDIRNFPVNNAAIKLSGTSHMEAKVNGRLDARLSGVSHLTIGGNPIMGNIRTSGASQLVKE
jgi:hypothetical protein